MHLIPASWSHLHMLVSVFPSVGLIFAIGFYTAAMSTNNETMKRACLFVFGCLGILAIPTYVSGEGSMAVLASQNKHIDAMLMGTHELWSWVAMFFLVLNGIVSFFALYRTRTLKLSDNILNLILGLALCTLLMMVVVGELGWEINHTEWLLPTPPSAFTGGGTPQIWAHFHVILNHFPTVGFVFGLFFYVAGIAMKNDGMKRGGLVTFVICAILGAPTYVTGASAMWAETNPPVHGISLYLVNKHRDWAALSMIGLGVTGVAAWMELFRYRHLGRFGDRALYWILGFAVITLALMAETGHRGGQIDHPEIRMAGDIINGDPTLGWSPHVELLINNVIWFVPWQTVHFFGFTLVFASVLAVSLRILGFWKSVPFSAVHRLLPLGVFGVAMNVFTGMLMLMADTSRYINEISFVPKMIFLPIGAIAVLYFSLSDKLWATKAGDDAPMRAKWVAVLVLVSWVIVIMGGRLLPYLFGYQFV